MKTSKSLLACLALTAVLLAVAPVSAEQHPSAEVLLPYFEVNLQNASGSNTLFDVGNALDAAVDVEISVYTNWGVPIATSQVTLAARQVRSFNLRSWLAGDLPGRRLSSAETSHVKAALTGQRSPQDNLYYASQVAPNLAVGYVRIETLGQPRPAALWGNYFLFGGGTSSAEGDTLINLDSGAGCTGGCKRHALRFLNSGAFDGGTQIVILSEAAARPSASSLPSGYVQADTLAYDEAGQPLGGNRLRLLPVQVISVADLGVRQASGWIDLATDSTSIVAVHYTSKKSQGVALMSYCLHDDPLPPGLHLEKRTNGVHATAAPGPSIKIGQPVLWEYIVENTGAVRLSDLQVSDDRGVAVSCPKNVLDPGDRMTCAGHGVAEACQYQNVGTATARTPDGQSVSAEDVSHYFGDQNASIDLELRVNGQDADAAPGPTVAAGSRIDWTYVVTNQGDVALDGVNVSDDKGDAVSCPKTSLRPGESMTCTASSTAGKGQFVKLATAVGKTACGEARDQDPGYYNSQGDDPPGISITKLTNGDDYSAGPGKSLPVGSSVRWDYVVKNIGQVRLDTVQVTDDREGAVSCPKSSLQPGESMTCTKTGAVKACQYSNVGTVTATASGGQSTSRSDTSWYFGQTAPAVAIKTLTNGQDANAAPGPEIPVGNPVQWTYVVTNTGNVALRDVHVADDHGVNVSCPKASLQPGESMTCSASGVSVQGQYHNVGTATGTADTSCGGSASASDPSYYLGTTISEPPKCNGRPSLDELWPPNHKMVDIQILGLQGLTTRIDGITQDEPVNELGDGNTGPDGAGVGTSTAQVRSERSGLGDGRVYVIHYTGRDSKGASCSGTVSVGVPHDQRGTPPVDSGQLYDSTVSH